MTTKSQDFSIQTPLSGISLSCFNKGLKIQSLLRGFCIANGIKELQTC